jgi:hypothetical protein
VGRIVTFLDEYHLSSAVTTGATASSKKTSRHKEYEDPKQSSCEEPSKVHCRVVFDARNYSVCNGVDIILIKFGRWHI